MGTQFQAGSGGIVLEVRKIDTYYGETQVLFGVSLGVGAGEVVALLGPSGASGVL